MSQEKVEYDVPMRYIDLLRRVEAGLEEGGQIRHQQAQDFYDALHIWSERMVCLEQDAMDLSSLCGTTAPTFPKARRLIRRQMDVLQRVYLQPTAKKQPKNRNHRATFIASLRACIDVMADLGEFCIEIITLATTKIQKLIDDNASLKTALDGSQSRQIELQVRLEKAEKELAVLQSERDETDSIGEQLDELDTVEESPTKGE